MKIAQAGTGGPVVVFEAGAGDGMESWAKVFPETATFTTAFAYSRRGYGFSLPVWSRRDGGTIVEELRGALAVRGLRPPYILVGHSIGGLYMQLFAKLHPEDVAGAVLVDTTHPDQLERMKSERPGNYALVQTAMKLNAAKTLGAEMRDLEETAREWHEAGSFPARPMILLSAGRANALDGAGFPEFMQRLHADIVAAWPGAERRVVDDSTHYIQRQRPEAVVGAIRELVDRFREEETLRIESLGPRTE